MIIRLVTMQFKDEEIETFLQIFYRYKSKIKAANGCRYLTLIQNIDNKNEISTLSHWDNESSLNSYRESETFKEVWPLTKSLFITAPTAISYSILTIV